MAKQNIDLGEGPGQTGADNLFDAFTKVIANFDELYDLKADADHVHAIADVAGLQSDLDDKAVAGPLADSLLTMSSGRIIGRTTTDTGAPEELTGAQVKTFLALQNVSNTSDANKPVSTATQDALDLKENAIAAANVLPATKYWRGDKTWQTLDKAAIGLPNVSNTSDADKPISTLAQAALDLKQNALPGGTNSQFLRGDKTFVAVTKSDVGLSNVQNTSDAMKPVFTATDNGIVTAPGASDFSSGDKWLASNGTWTAPTKAQVGLANVQNTSDAAKPISTATQTALNGKAAVDHTHVAADITDLSKSSVGLSNVDNTSDINKPISTAAANALALKANKSEIIGAVKFLFTGTLEVNQSAADVVGFPMVISLPNSRAKALTGNVDPVVLTIKKNGTDIGTVTFAANGTTGALDIPNSGDLNLTTADLVEVTLPGVELDGMTGITVVLRS